MLRQSAASSAQVKGATKQRCRLASKCRQCTNVSICRLSYANKYFVLQNCSSSRLITLLCSEASWLQYTCCLTRQPCSSCQIFSLCLTRQPCSSCHIQSSPHTPTLLIMSDTQSSPHTPTLLIMSYTVFASHANLAHHVIYLSLIHI